MATQDYPRHEVEPITPERRGELEMQFASLLRQTEKSILDAAEGKGEIEAAVAAQQKASEFYNRNIYVDANLQDKEGQAFSNKVYGQLLLIATL